MAGDEETQRVHARVDERTRRAIQRGTGQRDRGGVVPRERAGEREDDRYSRARRREGEAGGDVRWEEIVRVVQVAGGRGEDRGEGATGLGESRARSHLRHQQGGSREVRRVNDRSDGG